MVRSLAQSRGLPSNQPRSSESREGHKDSRRAEERARYFRLGRLADSLKQETPWREGRLADLAVIAGASIGPNGVPPVVVEMVARFEPAKKRREESL